MFPGLGSLVERLPCGASVVPFHAVGVVGLAQITFRGAGEHLQLVVALGGDAVQDVGAARDAVPLTTVGAVAPDLACGDLYALPVFEKLGELVRIDAALLVLADAANRAAVPIVMALDVDRLSRRERELDDARGDLVELVVAAARLARVRELPHLAMKFKLYQCSAVWLRLS